MKGKRISEVRITVREIEQSEPAEVVHQRDKFERQYAPKRNLVHAPAEGDRGEEIGAYALVEFKDGMVDWEFCDKALIERHRKHSKQPDSLMWTKFHEEAWKKTAIRILAKRLPLSNPGMETLAEVIERDARREMEPEPSGRLELEADLKKHLRIVTRFAR
jgi:recombination protein RecT